MTRIRPDGWIGGDLGEGSLRDAASGQSSRSRPSLQISASLARICSFSPPLGFGGFGSTVWAQVRYWVLLILSLLLEGNSSRTPTSVFLPILLLSSHTVSPSHPGMRHLLLHGLIDENFGCEIANLSFSFSPDEFCSRI